MYIYIYDKIMAIFANIRSKNCSSNIRKNGITPIRVIIIKEKQNLKKNSDVFVRSWCTLFSFFFFFPSTTIIYPTDDSSESVVTADSRRILATRVNKRKEKYNIAERREIYARYGRDNRLARTIREKSSLKLLLFEENRSRKWIQKVDPSKIFFIGRH